MTNDAGGSPRSASQGREYIVVARRYRPQNFQELVGQNQVSQALATAITTHRVGHAYLFTGARGVGKTSTARIFAKALNCVHGPTPTPCNQCDICQGIATGEDVDVLEIDGASNRGIDEIRQLRSNVNIRPSRARFKIYIIDEVHMLTLQAFNALLKTLEEPPEHVKFIFCTTDPEKIPITILSRCQRYDFPPVEARSIIDRLKFIVENEGVQADEEALQLLARRANGSLRDSQSLLEQLLSACPTHIGVQDVHAMLGTARSGQLATLATQLVQRDAAGALAELDVALGEGVDPGQLAEQLVGYFRDMLAATVGCEPDLLLHVPAADHPSLVEAGKQWGLETMLAAVQILDQAVARMRSSSHVRTLLEVALVRVARLESLDDLAEVVAQWRQGGLGGTSAAGAGNARPVSQKKNDLSGGVESPATANRRAVGREGASERTPAGLSATERTPAGHASAARAGLRESRDAEPSPASTTARHVPTVDSGEQQEAEPAPVAERRGDATPSSAAASDLWGEALAQLEDMTADFARYAEQVEWSSPDRLVARFRAAYTLHKEKCERPERRSKLEAALTKVAARPIRLDLELLASEPVTEVRAPAVQTNRQRMQERQRQPLVRQAIEMFDGEVLRVEEPRGSSR